MQNQGGVYHAFLTADSQLQAQLMAHAELNRKGEEAECWRCSASAGAGSSGQGGEGQGEVTGRPEEMEAAPALIRQRLRDALHETAPSVTDDHVQVE
jgi:hypothetical protein